MEDNKKYDMNHKTDYEEPIIVGDSLEMLDTYLIESKKSMYRYIFPTLKEDIRQGYLIHLLNTEFF
jgi:hypothetical protein